MAGLIGSNVGQAISSFGANIGNLMFKSIGDEADRDARIAAKKEEWQARLQDRQDARQENNDLRRELLETRLDFESTKASSKAASGSGGGKSGGINMEDIKPGGSQEVWAAAKLDMTVPEYTAFYNSLKTGDKSAFLQDVTRINVTPAAPGMDDPTGEMSDAVSRSTAIRTPETIKAPPPGFEAEYKAKMKKLADLQESYALGGQYDDVMKGRQQGFQTGVGEGVLAGAIRPGPGSEAVGASLAQDRFDVKGGEKVNVFTGDSTTTAVGQSEIAKNKAQAGSAGALSKKYTKEIEKINAEIKSGAFNKNSSEKLTSIINAANATIKSLDDSSKGSTPEAKAEWQRQRDDAVAIRDKAITLQKKGLDAREKPKPEPAPKADDAALKSKVEGRGMKYEPDKYQYRVNKDGSVDRRPK
jgi:hypothetical protein